MLIKKRFPIPSTNNVSLLENIAIYTYEEEVPLLTVFKTMYRKNRKEKKQINHKESGKKLTSFFSEILPDYDEIEYTPLILKK